MEEIIGKLSNDKMDTQIFKNKFKDSMVIIKKASNKTGSAERHENHSEMYYIMEGGAKLNYGGTIIDEKKVGEGEYKNKEAQDYETIKMNKGDFFFIPVNEVHQLVAEEEITYMIVKFKH